MGLLVEFTLYFIGWLFAETIVAVAVEAVLTAVGKGLLALGRSIFHLLGQAWKLIQHSKT